MHRRGIEGILEIERVRHRPIGERRHGQAHPLVESEERRPRPAAVGARKLDEG